MRNNVWGKHVCSQCVRVCVFMFSFSYSFSHTLLTCSMLTEIAVFFSHVFCVFYCHFLCYCTFSIFYELSILILGEKWVVNLCHKIMVVHNHLLLDLENSLTSQIHNEFYKMKSFRVKNWCAMENKQMCQFGFSKCFHQYCSSSSKINTAILGSTISRY